MARTTETSKLARELAPRMSRLVRVLLRDSGVSRTQLAVLRTLSDVGPCRVTELAASEHVAQPSMTALVKRLEGRGWVERRAHATDGRVAEIAITADGRDALARVSESAAATLAARLGGLDAAELDVLTAAIPILDRLVAPEGSVR